MANLKFTLEINSNKLNRVSLTQHASNKQCSTVKLMTGSVALKYYIIYSHLRDNSHRQESDSP